MWYTNSEKKKRTINNKMQTKRNIEIHNILLTNLIHKWLSRKRQAIKRSINRISMSQSEIHKNSTFMMNSRLNKYSSEGGGWPLTSSLKMSLASKNWIKKQPIYLSIKVSNCQIFPKTSSSSVFQFPRKCSSSYQSQIKYSGNFYQASIIFFIDGGQIMKTIA